MGLSFWRLYRVTIIKIGDQDVTMLKKKTCAVAEMSQIDAHEFGSE